MGKTVFFIQRTKLNNNNNNNNNNNKNNNNSNNNNNNNNNNKKERTCLPTRRRSLSFYIVSTSTVANHYFEISLEGEVHCQYNHAFVLTVKIKYNKILIYPVKLCLEAQS